MAQAPIGSGWLPYRARLMAATFALAQNFAGVAEAAMKTGAPWEDRTGLARSGLSAVARGDALAIGIELSHSMDYGRWLETVSGPAMGQRAHMSSEALESPELVGPFAIIHPTARVIAPQFTAGVMGLWSRHGV